MKCAKYMVFMIPFLIFFNINAYASYCTTLFMPDNDVIYDFGNITLEAGVSIKEKPFSFYHIGLGYGAAGYGNNSAGNQYGKNSKRYWMLYHFESQYNQGLRVAILADHYDIDLGDKVITITNYSNPYNGIVTNSSVCNAAGHRYWFLGDLPIVSSGLKVSVYRGEANPGHYEISIPFSFGVEENQYTDFIGTSPQIFQSILLEGLNHHHLKGNVDVFSSCHFIENQINFNFGDVSLNDALSGVKRKASFNISCTDPVRVKLSIQGGNLGPNMTSCGPGVCSVPIQGNGAASTTTTVSRSRYWELEAVFKTDKAFSGEFNGSLVLSMEFV
ncbi:hypothetical protein ABGP60_004862 [Escherichia coli]